MTAKIEDPPHRKNDLHVYINDQPPDPPAGENVAWPHSEYRFYSDKVHALVLNYFQLSPDTW